MAKEMSVEKVIKDRLDKLREAAASGDAKAMSDLGATYAIGEAVPQDWSEAFKWFESAAEANFTLAFVNLAGCYRDGDGVAKDPRKAVEWYRKAALADEPRAIEIIAELYLNGECGVSKDLQEAATWFKKGTEVGSYECLYQWGVCCATGRGVDKDFSQAAEAFRVAAEAGHPGAALDLGHCLMNGLGIAGGKKMTMAVKAYMQASEAGLPEAMYHLGMAYSNGLGVRRQDNAAAKWLMAASRAGHPSAMNELAQLYVTGRGVDRDLNAAVQWYRKSAELGNPESAAALGSAFGAGVGPIKADLDESAKWFRLAAKNGMSEAEDAVRDIEKVKVIRAQRQKLVDAHEAAWEKFAAAAGAAEGHDLKADDVPVPHGDTLSAILAAQDSSARKVRARWGPDAFSAKYGAAFPPDELDRVLEALTGLMEILTKETVARMGGLGVTGGGGGGGVIHRRVRPGTSGGAAGSPARMALPRVPEASPSPGSRGGAQPRMRPGTTVGVPRAGAGAVGGGVGVGGSGDRGGLPGYGVGRSGVRAASMGSGPGVPAGGGGGDGPSAAEAAASRAPRDRLNTAGSTLSGTTRRSSDASSWQLSSGSDVLRASGPGARPSTTGGGETASRHERSIPRPSEGGSGRRSRTTFDPAAFDPKSPYVAALQRPLSLKS